MMQPGSEQVKQQLHKQGIVQAGLHSCPRTWHSHADGHGQHSAAYLNRKRFSILETAHTSHQ